jgi:ammonia channel protein AmtB
MGITLCLAAQAKRRRRVQLVALCVLCLVALLLVYCLLTLATWFEGVLHKWSGPQEL